MKTTFRLPVVILGIFIILVVLFDGSELFPPFANYFFPIVFVVSLPGVVNIKWTSLHFLLCVFVLWSLFSLTWTVDPGPSETRAFTVLLMGVMFLMITGYGSKRTLEYRSIVYFFFIATTILLVWSFLAMNAYTLEALRATKQINTGLMESNGLGKYLAFGSIICLYYAMTKRIKGVLYICLYFVYLYMGLVLKSKSTLLAMIVGAFLFLYIYYKDKKEIKKFLVIVTLIVSVFVFVVQSGFFGDAFIRITNMADFAQGDDEADYSTFERLYFVQLGWSDFLNSPIIGHGIGSCGKLTGGTYYHNNYVQLLAETGIIGFVSYYLMIIWLIVKIWKYRLEYEGALFLAIIFTMLIGDTNNTTYYHKISYLVYGMCFLFVKSKMLVKEKGMNYLSPN